VRTISAGVGGKRRRKLTVKQARGFALAMTKMAFTGELDDVMDTVMANWREL